MRGSSRRDAATLGSVLLRWLCSVPVHGSGCGRATEPAVQTWKNTTCADADRPDGRQCPHKGRDLCWDESLSHFQHCRPPSPVRPVCLV